ncbi:PRP38 family protein [Cardiosporidium cionae]|uniref:Pre-mRNA-splicing factor 38 n=1 Tax=Cardiosporidium cionae TaxID=476202 RepID=A0ABQ7JGM2_9APIC|nr:PRP38 family protein [Cardiosporidium cionae]|eukprot:KAF8823114.1 PRP38 family protein [Cardiosporidium cionae]
MQPTAVNATQLTAPGASATTHSMINQPSLPQPPPPPPPFSQHSVYPYVTQGNAAPYMSYMGLTPHRAASQMVYYPAAGNPPPTMESEQDELAEVPRCHLHSKPQLKCKLCRKYKSAVHQIGRIGQAQESQRPTEERKNMVEMTDIQTFNVNNLLRGNILSSEYFKSLYQLKHYTEVVDELYQYAEHAEPYVAGSSRAPSTLFCCLYKFFTMKLTENQVTGLLDHVDSPYIRSAGFLYLRYVHPPEKLWSWFEPYFLDDEEFTPGSDKVRTMNMGEYVESLITEDKYFNTVLPRLPVKIKNQYGAQLIALDEHRKRKKLNKAQLHEFVEGRKVSACSNGDWLDGEVLDIDDSLPGRVSVIVKLEDGNEEMIDIGLVVLHEKHRERSRSKERKKSKHKKKGKTHHSGRRSRSRSKERHRRSYSRSRSRSASMIKGDTKAVPKTQEELLIEFRRREREKALATGKDYARRPTSYKSSLSLKLDTCSTRKRSSKLATHGFLLYLNECSVSTAASFIPPSLCAIFVFVPWSNSPRYSGRERQHYSAKASSPSRTESKRKEPSMEHKHKMAQLMERYSKIQVDPTQQRKDEEGPDVMRLG